MESNNKTTEDLLTYLGTEYSTELREHIEDIIKYPVVEIHSEKLKKLVQILNKVEEFVPSVAEKELEGKETHGKSQ